MTEQCFDVTDALGENPVELAHGYVNGQLVMFAVRKSTKHGMHVAAMWEVKNGLHIKDTVSLLSCRGEVGGKLIDALWLLYGEDNTNLTEIKIRKYQVSSAGEFWEEIKKLGASEAVSKTRLSPKMQKQLRNEPERFSERH